MYNHSETIMIITLDDLLVAASNISGIEDIKRKLMDKFKMSDMGNISLVLGMQVTRDRERGTLTITQFLYDWNGEL